MRRMAFSAMLVAMFATVAAVPALALADEASPPNGEVTGSGANHATAHSEATREAVRACFKQSLENGRTREELRRCLADAAMDALPAEVQQCIEAVHAQGGERDDLRRCFVAASTDAHPANTPPTSILDRVPRLPSD